MTLPSSLPPLKVLVTFSLPSPTSTKGPGDLSSTTTTITRGPSGDDRPTGEGQDDPGSEGDGAPRAHRGVGGKPEET